MTNSKDKHKHKDKDKDKDNDTDKHTDQDIDKGNDADTGQAKATTKDKTEKAHTKSPQLSPKVTASAGEPLNLRPQTEIEINVNAMMSMLTQLTISHSQLVTKVCCQLACWACLQVDDVEFR